MPDGINSADLRTSRPGHPYEPVDALQARLLAGDALSSGDTHYLCEMARRGIDSDRITDAAAEFPTGTSVEDEECPVETRLLRRLTRAVETYRLGRPALPHPHEGIL